eukprot:scaffold131695_cov69-Phaeocystis_antarctica.AAC.6
MSAGAVHSAHAGPWVRSLTYPVIPAAGVYESEGISRQLNCDATWKVACRLLASAWRSITSASMAEKRRPRWSWPAAGADLLSWYLLRSSDSVGVEKVPIAHCWPLASDLSMLPSASFSRGSTSKNVSGAASSTTFFGPNSLKPNSSENHRFRVAPAYIAQMPLGRVDGTRSAGRVAPVYIVQAPLGRVDGTRSAGRSARLVIVGASANAIHTRAAPMESRPCVRAARSLITERQRSERFSDRREKANSTIGRKCAVLAALGVI